MIDLYKYTETEQNQIFKSIVIIQDTREKKADHITKWFDQQGIPYITKKLDQGDYSFYIPQNEQLGIPRDLFFDKRIMIERKASLDELAGNFTKRRADFIEEMVSYPGKKLLLIENSSYEDIVQGNYRSEFSSKAYLGSIHSFLHKYGLSLMFMPNPAMSGCFIYGHFLYFAKNFLR